MTDDKVVQGLHEQLDGLAKAVVTLDNGLAEHHRELGELVDVVNDVDNALVEHRDAIAILTQNLKALGDDVGTLVASQAWAAGEHADGLTEWANNWLIPTFYLHVDLREWDQCPGVTSELAALHLEFQAMGSQPGPRQTAWHASLEGAIRRIREIVKRRRSHYLHENTNRTLGG